MTHEKAILESELREKGLLARYEELCKTSHWRLAGMLAEQTPPGHRGTKRSYWEGRSVSEYDDNVGQLVLEDAQAAGVSTHGKIYVGGLSDERGPADPFAWVSDQDEVLSKAKALGDVGVRGAVNLPTPKLDPLPDIPLAEDLVEHHVNRIVAEDPALAEKPAQELREKVIDEVGAPASGGAGHE